MTAFLTGLALGVAGSGHCAAMCGPLVLTIGRRLGRPSRAEQARHTALYQLGRVLVYVMIAIPAGLAGQILAAQALGRGIAVIGAIVLVLAAIGSVRPGILGRLATGWGVQARRLAAHARQWASAYPLVAPSVMGAVNGLLPCGLVYAAAGAAVAFGSVADAVLLMAGFGLGTTPMLAALSLSAAAVPIGVRVRLRQLTPIVLLITAALLLVRAVGLPHHAPTGADHQIPEVRHHF